MSIWYPGKKTRKQETRDVAHQQRESAEYRKKMEEEAARIIQNIKHLKVEDVNAVFEIIKQRLGKSFNEKDIGSLIDNGKETNQSKSKENS